VRCIGVGAQHRHRIDGFRKAARAGIFEREPRRLRDQVVRRVEALHLPSYTGFVMPKLDAVRNAAGEITDVTISYPQDLREQMLEYSAQTRGLRP